MGPIATRQAPNDEDRALLQTILDGTGMQCKWSAAAGFTRYDNNAPWNPLADDGDALRLAVDLGMDFRIVLQKNFATQTGNVTHVSIDDPQWTDREPHGDDPYAATRRAIVRAAAEIGKAKA
jgi:hypothetical protein